MAMAQERAGVVNPPAKVADAAADRL